MKGKGDIYVFAICKRCSYRRTGQTSIASKSNSSDSKQTDTNENSEVTYILNTNSKKIHCPDCDSVNKMSPRNKKKTNQSKEKLIQEGYTPCQSCNP